MVNLKSRRILLASILVAAVALTVTGLALSGIIPLTTILSCIGTPGTSRSFTIIADLNGYNNSRNLPPSYNFGPGLGYWPIMNVSRCDHVFITLMNVDNQAHGLAVGSYTGEFSIGPHQSLTVDFVANRTGQWRVFCTITCTVHDYMQNGQLNVT